jgi:hypothetical protein
MADGAASVYMSGGGGYLGGQSHETIRSAAMKAVEAAAAVQPTMRLAIDFPLPQRGHLSLYALTDEGVFTANASEQELSSNDHPLSNLADAMQEVVTQYRLMQNEK